MSSRRTLSKEQIHARAVRLGRRRGFTAEAGRLAASDPGSHIDRMIASVRDSAWEVMTDDIIMDALADRLWLNWITVEYRAVALANVS